MPNRGEQIAFFVINLFAVLSPFLSTVASSIPFHLCGLATALRRGLRGVEPDKTCHFYKKYLHYCFLCNEIFTSVVNKLLSQKDLLVSARNEH
jgi:hypothetical protein